MKVPDTQWFIRASVYHERECVFRLFENQVLLCFFFLQLFFKPPAGFVRKMDLWRKFLLEEEIDMIFGASVMGLH